MNRNQDTHDGVVVSVVRDGIGEKGLRLFDWTVLRFIFEVEERVAIGLFFDDAHGCKLEESFFVNDVLGDSDGGLFVEGIFSLLLGENHDGFRGRPYAYFSSGLNFSGLSL